MKEIKMIRKDRCQRPFIFVWIFTVIMLIAGVTVHVLYIERFEATCTEYISCPLFSDGSSEFKGQCVTGLTHGNVRIYGQLELKSHAYSLPSRCWVQNKVIAMENPTDARFITFMCIASLIGFYVIFEIREFILTGTEALEKIGTDSDHHTNSNGEDICNCFCAQDIKIEVFEISWIVVTWSLIVLFISMFVILGSYDLPYYEIVCTNYARSSSSYVLNQVEWYKYNNNNNNNLTKISGINKILPSTFRPSDFPTRCWKTDDINNGITFYNPTDLYKVIGTVICTWIGIFIIFIIANTLCPKKIDPPINKCKKCKCKYRRQPLPSQETQTVLPIGVSVTKTTKINIEVKGEKIET
jgi:hypothetical protein